MDTELACFLASLVVEVSSNECEPSDRDILYVEGDGLAFMEFSSDDCCLMAETYGDNLDAPAPPLTRHIFSRTKGVNIGS